MNVVKTKRYIYSGESKVLQYFGNMRCNSAAPDAFSNVVKVSNHTKPQYTNHA